MKYTEAHFASVLLSCGPHITGYSQAIIASDDMPDVRLANNYRDRVYNHFLELFPGYATIDGAGVGKAGQGQWCTFWRAYLKWVET